MKKLLAAASLACLFALPAHAATIFTEDFGNGADGFNATPNGWTVQTGVLDIIGGTGTFYNWYPGNGSYLDLDGSDGAAGQNTFLTFNTPFTFTPGSYEWKFDFGLNFNDGGDTDLIELGLWLGGSNFIALAFADPGASGTNGGAFMQASGLWQLIGVPLTGQIYIRGLSVGGADQSGGIIDNIQVSSVPLPGAALLLLSGILGLGGVSRFRRKV
jgi:hypothetical protein